MWVIVTLASLAVILILVLSVPFDTVLHVDMYGRPKFRLRLSWLFGLITKEVEKREKKPTEKKKVVKEKQKLAESKRRIGDIFAILRTRGLLRQFIVLITDILRRFKIRDFIVDFRVGLGNPADTGLLFALIGPATFLLSSSFPHQIRVEPSFEDETAFEGHLSGTVRLRPIQLVSPLIKFTFSLATIRVVKKLVLTKLKRKK